jgi:hypothetical protein
MRYAVVIGVIDAPSLRSQIVTERMSTLRAVVRSPDWDRPKKERDRLEKGRSFADRRPP